jgi:biopolymer transport protein ExbB
MSIDNLLHLASSSGGVLYALLAMLFVALTIIVERYWYLHRAARSSRQALLEINRLDHLDARALEAVAERYAGQSVARVLQTAARFHAASSSEKLAAHLDEAIMLEAPRIDRLLWVLDTIVTLAPLLGLLGTIIGMFNAFQVLSDPGNAPTQVTGGVAEALLATASGLFVAMIGLVFFNGLHNRVRGIVHQLETSKVMLVNRLVAHAPLEQVKEVRSARAISAQLAQQGS